MRERPIWLDYALCYPFADEPGYDGVHDGGYKCLRDDAPEAMKRAFERDMKPLYDEDGRLIRV